MFCFGFFSFLFLDYIRECISDTLDYRGRRSWTKSNITCQAWADNNINEHRSVASALTWKVYFNESSSIKLSHGTIPELVYILMKWEYLRSNCSTAFKCYRDSLCVITELEDEEKLREENYPIINGQEMDRRMEEWFSKTKLLQKVWPCFTKGHLDASVLSQVSRQYVKIYCAMAKI